MFYIIFRFSDAMAKIYMDEILPRILELSLNSKFRRTRIAACEALHVFIVFIIGKEAYAPDRGKQMTKMYEKVFPAMLKLASDTDSVVIKVINKKVFSFFLLLLWFFFRLEQVFSKNF